MWLSRRGGIAGERRGTSGMGQVTIGGMQPAVYTEGEVRRAEVYSPVGYYWAPLAGDDAMVLQAGDLGEEACLAGVCKAPPIPLEPGEAVIGVADSYIHIGRNGITLHGMINLDGVLDIRGKLFVDGEVGAQPLVNLDGSVYINGIFQLAE